MAEAARQVTAIVVTEEDALEVIDALAEKFGIKVHLWGTKEVNSLLEEAGIDAGVDPEELSEETKQEVIREFKESQPWQETGLDVDIAMQDELANILSRL